MTFDLVRDLDWLAVVVAAIAYFVLGAAWYAPPVLGRIWMEAGGASAGGPRTNGSGGGTQPSGAGPGIYLVPLVGSLLSSIAIGMLAVASDTSGASEGLALGLVVAIGFAAPICFVTATFETKKPKPMVWGAVNAGYHGLGNLLAGLIIGLMA